MLVISVFAVASAQDTTVTQSTTTRTVTTHRYYYYPGSNVYYDEASGNYWYYDQPTTTWMTVQTLPSTIALDKSARYRINYTGDDPWKQNSMHMKKYKMKKNGKTKTKPAKT